MENKELEEVTLSLNIRVDILEARVKSQQAIIDRVYILLNMRD